MEAVLGRRWLQHNQTPFPKGISPPPKKPTKKDPFPSFFSHPIKKNPIFATYLI
jgi:hypothetical protein